MINKIKIIYFPLMFWVSAMVPLPNVILVRKKEVKEYFEEYLFQTSIGLSNSLKHGYLTLFCHELYHVKQIRVKGYSWFLWQWIKGFIIPGQSNDPVEKWIYDYQDDIVRKHNTGKKLKKWFKEDELKTL